jgi:TRAP-type C4-dicarboxylate transport system permease small subunit
MDLVIALLGVALCAFIAKIGYDSLQRQIAYGTLSPSGYLPNWPQSLAIPLCFALMTIAQLSYLYAVLTRRHRQSDDAGKLPEV